VKLQSGDEESLKSWRSIVERSEKEFKEVYRILEISDKLESFGES